MKVDVLLGLQWGDEGKGKAVDVLTPHYDVVARFQGAYYYKLISQNTPLFRQSVWAIVMNFLPKIWNQEVLRKCHHLGS